MTALGADPGRAAYEARFAHARPRDVEPWDSLTPEVKDIWRRVAAACRAPLWAETAGAQAERAEICRELGCVDKPGVPLRFVQELRRQLCEANARTFELIRMWDPASHTERQELDRMRRGWGASTPTERELRRSDVAACIQAVSIAMSDVSISEEEADDVPEEAQTRLDEAYERLAKVHTKLVETVHRIAADPKEWPDIKAAEERGAETLRKSLLTGGEREAVQSIAEYLRDSEGEPYRTDDDQIIASAPPVPPDGGCPGLFTFGDLRAVHAVVARLLENTAIPNSEVTQ